MKAGEVVRWFWFWGPPLGWVLLMQVLTLRPSYHPGLDWLTRYDKLAHLVYFGAFGLMCYRAWRGAPGYAPVTAAWLAFSLTLLYGSADELKQFLQPHRHVEWGDWMANLAGASLSLLCPWWRPGGRKA